MYQNTKDSFVLNIQKDAFVTYCLYLIGYNVLLVLYSFVFMHDQQAFVQSLLIITPVNLLLIYFSKWNYALVSKVAVLIYFCMQTMYLLLYKYNETISNCAMVQFFMIVFFTLICVNQYWSISIFCLSLVILILDYALYFYDDSGLMPVEGNKLNVYDGFVMNILNLFCLFLFLIRIIQLTAKYYEKYTNELLKTEMLYKSLMAKNEDLLQLNSQLTQNMKNLDHSYQKLREYSWLNSHKIRGPLVRILGILNLIEIDEFQSNLKLYHSGLKESAHELDERIREINKLLEAESQPLIS